MIHMKTTLCILCLSIGVVTAQTNSPGFPRDTSYTLESAFQKYKKDYPHIKAVTYNPAEGSLQVADISYTTGSGRSLSLDLFTAAQATEPMRPIVMLIHGGGWSSGDKSLMHPLADYLARHGFVTVTVEYRLSPEALYPAGVNDLKSALTWIIEHGDEYHADKDRMAVLGCSAGAQLAGQIGLTYKNPENPSADPIQAIINIDGVMDFTCEEALKHEDNPEKETTAAGRWFGGRYAEKPELWREASPVYYINESSPPILFLNSSIPRFHAGRDGVIEKLDNFGIYSEVQTFDDAPHSFWLFDPWFEPTGRRIVNFLNKVFKDAAES